MAEDLPEQQNQGEAAEAAPMSGPSHNWVLYSVVVAVCAVLGTVGCYLLAGFLSSRPVDLVPLAEDNEHIIIEVLPHVGELLSESEEELHDDLALWRRYSKLIRLHPEVEPEDARTLVRYALQNDELTVKIERAPHGAPVLTVSYLGYMTHQIEMENEPALERIAIPIPTVTPVRAQMAIIVDDLGYNSKGLEKLFSINAPLTVSVLPRLELSAQLAEQAREHGFEVMLHLPLEGRADAPVNEGTLTSGMDDDTLRTMFDENLASVPGAVGINNHQGSTFTTDYEATNRLMQMIKDSGLFFVDSRASSESVAERVAREHGVKTASNNMFLDNVDDELYVEERLVALENMALERGAAIGICHVHKPSSMAVLERCLAKLDTVKIELVPVSELVH